VNIFLVEPFGHLEGHGSPYTYKLTKALLGIGHNVHLVSAAGFRDDWPSRLPVAHTPVLGKGGVKPGKGIFWAARRLNEHFRIQECAFHMAERLPNSIVHVIDFDPVTLCVARKTIRAIRRPVVTLGWISSDVWIQRWYQKSLPERARSVVAAAYYGILLNKLITSIVHDAEVVVHSRRVGARAEELGLIKHATFIPWGTDVRKPACTRESARARLGIANDRCVGIFFGATRRDKGLELLINAVARLPRGTVHIIIAGKKIDGADPVALTAHLGCSSDFTFHRGWIAEEECDLFFTASDFTVLPYLPGFEGDSGVLSYACEYGLPVIASDTGELGSRVLATNLGPVFEAGCCDQLVDKLLEFAALTATELATFRANCSRYTQANSWEAVARQHTAVYEKALHDGLRN
jgi:glycosyltransferase involved in cell wall biosynthesis